MESAARQRNAAKQAAAAAAAEEANEPHAVGPSPEVVVAASDLVDEILPTCVAHLGGGVGPGGGEAVVMASLVGSYTSSLFTYGPK